VRVAFPHQDELARKFFAEALRHLGDARILHRERRYPGAVTCSMKAAELAIKAVLIVDGSLGWWDKIQQTHKPLEEIKNHPVLTHHYQRLRSHNPALIVGVTALEQLAPSRPETKGYKFETQANTAVGTSGFIRMPRKPR
jgi:hypothetical protein